MKSKVNKEFCKNQKFNLNKTLATLKQEKTKLEEIYQVYHELVNRNITEVHTHIIVAKMNQIIGRCMQIELELGNAEIEFAMWDEFAQKIPKIKTNLILLHK